MPPSGVVDALVAHGDLLQNHRLVRHYPDDPRLVVPFLEMKPAIRIGGGGARRHVILVVRPDRFWTSSVPCTGLP